MSCIDAFVVLRRFFHFVYSFGLRFQLRPNWSGKPTISVSVCLILLPPLEKMMHRTVPVADFIGRAGGDGLVHKRFGFLNGCLDILAFGHITGNRR